MYNKKLQKERYEFLKSKGICAHCGQDNAMINSLICPECAIKKRNYDRRRYLKMKQTHYEEYKAHHRKSAKEQRDKRQASGMCTTCGKRQAQKGKRSCLDCLTRFRNEYQKRHPISRSERNSYGFCSLCGLPKMDGHGVCKKHYRIAVENLKPGVMTEKRKIHNEEYKRFFKLIFMRKKIKCRKY